MELKVIARIHNDYKEKFGIPRQSGLADCISTIVFEPEYRDANALRGMEGFSHLWLIWEFSENRRDAFSPTVRPPRLGGNTRIGVFATRSSFRPNALGLSSVELVGIDYDCQTGPCLRVKGADLMDNTPIYDIKPYLPQFDSHPEATFGFVSENADYMLEVVFPDDLLSMVPKSKQEALMQALAQDPRPQYQDDSSRVYGMTYGGQNVSFKVEDKVLTVVSVKEREK